MQADTPLNTPSGTRLETPPGFSLHDLTGRTALVCGGSAGIGYAAAVALAQRGARLVLVARDAGRLARAAAQLPRSELHHQVLPLDLSRPENLREPLEALLAETAIDILVNNSGGPAPGPLTEASAAGFLAAFNQHVLSAQALVQILLPGMQQRAFGRIINVISVGAKTPLPNLGVSNTIRGAVANWAKTLAREVAPFGVTVNNALPGFIATDRLAALIDGQAAACGRSAAEVRADFARQVPAGRIGQPAEIGEVIAFLASPAASYVNGINLPVDGGKTDCL